MKKKFLGIFIFILPVWAGANQSYRLVDEDLKLRDFDFVAPIVAGDGDVPARAGLIYYDVGVGLKIINPSGVVESISGGSSNPVVTPAAGITNICSGYISNSGTPAVVRSDGSCIASVTDTAPGRVGVNFASGTFSSAPTCYTTAIAATATGTDTCRIEADATSSNVAVICFDGTNVDTPFHVLCVGPK